MARKLQPGQRAELHIIEVDTGTSQLRHASETLLFEAPNWSPDGCSLFINGDGRLFRLDYDGARLAEGGTAGSALAEISLAEIPLGGIAGINNDHLIGPDGRTAYVSSEDGHLYAVALAGKSMGTPRRVTNDNGTNFRHYLHGISPDGVTLAYIGMVTSGAEVRTNVYTIAAAGGPDTQLTDDDFADDGAEFSPDGQWIYFNSERGSTEAGHAQLFRMPAPGSNVSGSNHSGAAPEQLTFDERVNWFPHPSPDGSKIAYVSFPKGTLGHPADVPVVVRLLEADGTIRDLAHVFGGQGTMNVPSWSPDGRKIAIVAYPMAEGRGSRRV